jgi:parallel beta-helix repeat protein
MHKIKGILVSILLLLSMLAIIAPISAGTINVYPGNDLATILTNAASGDTVYIHAGTYTISNPINITDKNITIIGDGPSSTIVNLVNNGRIDAQMSGALSSNITVNISDISFIGDETLTPNSLVIITGESADFSMIVNITGCVFNRSSTQSIAFYADNPNGIIATIKNCELMNASSSGAAGIHSYGYSQVTVTNCLIYDNYYGMRFEGSSQGNVQSSTIDNNSYAGIDYPTAEATGYVIDSIVTNNTTYGILKSGGAGTVTCTYNNVWNNGTDYSGTTAGAGSISQNPLYATGRLGAYYLSNSSPCVDKGSATAASLGLDKMTTRADERWDTDTVDLGYHYVSNWVSKKSLPIAKILEILKLNKNK